MANQKARIIRRFEREAKKKYKEMEKAGVKVVCPCDKPNWHLVSFGIDEIKRIINWKDEDEISQCKSCYCMTKTIKGKCGKCKADKILEIKDGK